MQLRSLENTSPSWTARASGKPRSSPVTMRSRRNSPSIGHGPCCRIPRAALKSAIISMMSVSPADTAQHRRRTATASRSPRIPARSCSLTWFLPSHAPTTRTSHSTSRKTTDGTKQSRSALQRSVQRSSCAEQSLQVKFGRCGSRIPTRSTRRTPVATRRASQFRLLREIPSPTSLKR